MTQTQGDELRAIKRYLAIRTDKLPWLFVSERGQPMTRQAVNYLVARINFIMPHRDDGRDVSPAAGAEKLRERCRWPAY